MSVHFPVICAITPVQKADNRYPLDDSAIGFTNTYPLGRYPAFEQPGHGSCLGHVLHFLGVGK